MWQSKREISRECNDIIGSAKGSQISEKIWGEVGKGKRVDVYLEVRKRRGHIFFEWNKCLWVNGYLRTSIQNWCRQSFKNNTVISIIMYSEENAVKRYTFVFYLWKKWMIKVTQKSLLRLTTLTRYFKFGAILWKKICLMIFQVWHCIW
jgi:hypothetical protein